MKNYLCLFILVAAHAVFAQQGIGLVSGVNIEKVDESNSLVSKNYSLVNYQYDYPIGYTLGLYYERPISKHTGIHLEFVYNYSINKFQFYSSYEDFEYYTYKKYSLSIPILLEKKFTYGFHINVGFQTVYHIHITREFHSRIYYSQRVDKDVTSELPSFDYYFCFGGGKKFNILSKNCSIEFRCLKGINDTEYFGKASDGWKYVQFQLLLNIGLK